MCLSHVRHTVKYTAVCPPMLNLKTSQYAPHGLTHGRVTWLCLARPSTRPGT
ncbi:hypothetical protein F383_27505 [Gossypium arboreum]|uniref:Uncharacterized protein n=1 Tax=Gossypium arboreum TaxID=29729 RepID=A0A0B0PBY3_GOSAR|nr:hypothetical protein F383_27505 [Gossypium arboreum]